jgi:hypothetical protein
MHFRRCRDDELNGASIRTVGTSRLAWHREGDDMAKQPGSKLDSGDYQSTMPIRERSAKSRFDGPERSKLPRPRLIEDDCESPSYHEFAKLVALEISARGPLEMLLLARIADAAWQVHAFEADPRVPEAVRAERRMDAGLNSLRNLRELVQFGEVSRRLQIEERAIADSAAVEDPRWRDRLSWESTISEVSPVVRGTWITVGQVVSRIVDGWSWADILRAHPELCEDDIRACLSFTVEEDEMG